MAQLRRAEFERVCSEYEDARKTIDDFLLQSLARLESTGTRDLVMDSEDDGFDVSDTRSTFPMSNSDGIQRSVSLGTTRPSKTKDESKMTDQERTMHQLQEARARIRSERPSFESREVQILNAVRRNSEDIAILHETIHAMLGRGAGSAGPHRLASPG